MTTSSASEPESTLLPSISLCRIDKRVSSPNLDNLSSVTLESTTSEFDASSTGTGGTAPTTTTVTMERPPSDVDDSDNEEDYYSTAQQQPVTLTLITPMNDGHLLLPRVLSSPSSPTEGTIPTPTTLSIPVTTQEMLVMSILDPTIPPVVVNDTPYSVEDLLGTTRDSLDTENRTTFTEEEDEQLHETLQIPIMDDNNNKIDDDHHHHHSESKSIPLQPPLGIINGVDMTMTSPTRQTKSPPGSTSSSTMSGSRRRIAESSMILSVAGNGSETGIGSGSNKVSGLKGGTLSPAWSMTSIPRDISATYDTDANDGNTVSSVPPVDEKLYGLVDR
jgi:hypothetical protein